jgi:hypothetical protein
MHIFSGNYLHATYEKVEDDYTDPKTKVNQLQKEDSDVADFGEWIQTWSEAIFIKWINILFCLIKWDIKWYTFRTYVGCLFIFSLKKNVLIHGSWVYNYICNQYLSPLKLWVRIPFMARCTRYNLMWYSLSVNCGRSVVFSAYSRLLHQ